MKTSLKGRLREEGIEDMCIHPYTFSRIGSKSVNRSALEVPRFYLVHPETPGLLL
jgi:hypothetical protein